MPLILEYEAVANCMLAEISLNGADVHALLDYVCAVGQPEQIFYLWRPFLRDAEDDMVLELAVTSRSRYIVAYNIRDFSGTEHFGIQV